MKASMVGTHTKLCVLTMYSTYCEGECNSEYFFNIYPGLGRSHAHCAKNVSRARFMRDFIKNYQIF